MRPWNRRSHTDWREQTNYIPRRICDCQLSITIWSMNLANICWKIDGLLLYKLPARLDIQQSSASWSQKFQTLFDIITADELEVLTESPKYGSTCEKLTHIYRFCISMEFWNNPLTGHGIYFSKRPLGEVVGWEGWEHEVRTLPRGQFLTISWDHHSEDLHQTIFTYTVQNLSGIVSLLFHVYGAFGVHSVKTYLNSFEASNIDSTFAPRWLKRWTSLCRCLFKSTGSKQKLYAVSNCGASSETLSTQCEHNVASFKNRTVYRPIWLIVKCSIATLLFHVRF